MRLFSKLTKAFFPLAALIAQPAPAQESVTGIYFQNKDWELACDNTRTCRAAGYHAEGDDAPPVSVLLTRRAGRDQNVEGQLQLGGGGDEDGQGKKPPTQFTLTMKINGQNLGTVAMRSDTRIASLSKPQTSALLAALTRTSEISWRQDDKEWKLSDQGAAAVLLKMDEFQGRLGTPSALIRKGNRDESAVLPELPKPEIAIPFKEQDNQPLAQLPKAQSAALLAELKRTTKTDACEMLFEKGDAAPELGIYRLSAGKLLASTSCWQAAYNEGDGYWVINDHAPFKPVAVTLSGSSFEHGRIAAFQKGRGIADCVSQEEWAWDGAQFKQSLAMTTGQCKEIQPGGAWNLPTLSTTLKYKR